MAAPIVGHLGQAAPGAATNGNVYTVPAGRRAVISTLVAAETNGVATTIRIFSRINGAAAAVGNAIAYGLALGANSHIGFTEGIALAAGDIITVYSASGNVTFTAYGEETDVPTA